MAIFFRQDLPIVSIFAYITPMRIPSEIEREFIFKTSRSSGAGGQNVNKVETKVELHLDIPHSAYLNEEEKKIIREKLKNRINKDGILILSSESERTQQGNKKIVVKKFFQMVEHSLKKQKKRIPTKPSKSSGEKRLKKKKIRSEFKKLRKKDWEI